MARPGRPRTNTEGVMLRLPRPLLARIDDLRRVETEIPSRQDMIRRMLEEAIASEEQKAG